MMALESNLQNCINDFRSNCKLLIIYDLRFILGYLSRLEPHLSETLIESCFLKISKCLVINEEKVFEHIFKNNQEIYWFDSYLYVFRYSKNVDADVHILSNIFNIFLQMIDSELKIQSYQTRLLFKKYSSFDYISMSSWVDTISGNGFIRDSEEFLNEFRQMIESY